MLNVLMLAYGGAAYPADIRDLVIAAQSFRWPYFRILVCHTTAIPPFPAPQTWNSINMVVWLRQLARATKNKQQPQQYIDQKHCSYIFNRIE